MPVFKIIGDSKERVITNPAERFEYFDKKIQKFSDKLNNETEFDYFVEDDLGGVIQEGTCFLNEAKDYFSSYNSDFQINIQYAFHSIIDEMFTEIGDETFLNYSEMYWLIYEIVREYDHVFPYKPDIIDEIVNTIDFDKYKKL